NISTTQIYAEATNQKIDEDMSLLEERIENKYSFLW
ncbi:Tyrosine recombinase XerC, partial [termite gut metagenome]